VQEGDCALEVGLEPVPKPQEHAEFRARTREDERVELGLAFEQCMETDRPAQRVPYEHATVGRFGDREHVVGVRRERLVAGVGVDVLALAVTAQIEGDPTVCVLLYPETVIGPAAVNVTKPRLLGIYCAVGRLAPVVNGSFHAVRTTDRSIKTPHRRATRPGAGPAVGVPTLAKHFYRSTPNLMLG
jgi:hypothetical protein